MINLTDKKALLKQFKESQLNKSLTMFEWQNLPDTLPMVELEKMLQINGYAIIAKYQNNVYAFQGGFTGQDAYNRPTQVIVNNPALKLNTTYTINEDCIVIVNDDMKQGLIKIYEYFGQRLIENQITMLMTDYNLRMPFTISSSDDQTTQSAKDYLNKIIDGSLGVIGEQKLFKALNVTPTNSKQTATFSDLYGYQQFILAQLNNTIGLATNNNMKRERLTTNEIEINKNASYPLVDNMLRNRQQAVEQINKMFGLDISVEYNSIWGNDSKVNDDETNSDDNVNIVDNSNNKPVNSSTTQQEENEENSESYEDDTESQETDEIDNTNEDVASETDEEDASSETDETDASSETDETDASSETDETDASSETDKTDASSETDEEDEETKKEHDKK